MSVTLGHWLLLMALVIPVAVWTMTRAMRDSDYAKPEGQRRPVGLILAASLLCSAGLVSVALLHPVGKLVLL